MSDAPTRGMPDAPHGPGGPGTPDAPHGSGGPGTPDLSAAPAGQALPRTVAIDGPAGSGKSTVARLLAQRMGAQRLDTGAMYRAVAWKALHEGIDPADVDAVAALVAAVAIDVDGGTVTVDGEDATAGIRTPDVDGAVSAVAANPAVRRELVARQRAWVAHHGTVVVEGRDIGTVVMPDADVKVYLTASVAERARRRSAERGEGEAPHAVAAVAAQLRRRDDLDSTRQDSPLLRPEDVAGDALVLDTTDLAPPAIVDAVLARWEADRPRRTVREPDGERTASTAASAGGEDDAVPGVATARAVAPALAATLRRGGSCGASTSGAGASGASAGQRARVAIGVSDGAYRVIRRLVRGINRGYWRVTVDGAERVPASGPVILAPVHRSFVDFFVVSEATRRKVFYMAKEELWKSPRLGSLVTALGGFPVNRSGADREALERAQAVLERGDVLILFPEGTRRKGPEITDILEGATFLAARTGAVVVPIGIGGSDRVMPLGSKVPRPTRVHLVVGEPLAPPARSASGRVPRSQVRAMSDALRVELQRCFDEARAAVR